MNSTVRSVNHWSISRLVSEAEVIAVKVTYSPVSQLNKLVSSRNSGSSAAFIQLISSEISLAYTGKWQEDNQGQKGQVFVW